MDVVLLGTGSPIPHPERAGPATLVKAGGANLLIDTGRGVIMRLMGAGTPPPALSAILLTHMHSDHICDLNDVITTHWIMTPAPMPLKIYGPKGVAALVEATLAMLAFDVRYRMDHHDDLNAPPQVEAIELEPGDAFTVGYRIEAGAASVAVAGDTIPCPELDAMCLGADVYVQTVIRRDLVERVPSQRFQDILDYHSTVEDAGRTAARAGVKTLLLTHYVPPILPGQEDEWRALASAQFGGAVVLGPDLTSVSVAE